MNSRGACASVYYQPLAHAPPRYLSALSALTCSIAFYTQLSRELMDDIPPALV